MNSKLDHVIVVAPTLEAGNAWLLDITGGVQAKIGGKHPSYVKLEKFLALSEADSVISRWNTADYGTHNALVSLGDVYLEVMAIDPSVPSPPPAGAHMIGLTPASTSIPHTKTWCVSTSDIQAAAKIVEEVTGIKYTLKPGGRELPDGSKLSWTVAFLDPPGVAFDGCLPFFIQWDGPAEAHPSRTAPFGTPFSSLVVSHPTKSAQIKLVLDKINLDQAKISVVQSPNTRPSLQASILHSLHRLPVVIGGIEQSVFIRSADTQEDEDAMNTVFRELQFFLADLKTHIGFLAESREHGRIGWGRFVPYAPGVYEMSGIFVKEEFRGCGLARLLVEHILRNIPKDTTVLYCLPFENLVEFYRSFGFDRSPHDRPEVPAKLKEKFSNCQSTHSNGVALLTYSRLNLQVK